MTVEVEVTMSDLQAEIKELKKQLEYKTKEVEGWSRIKTEDFTKLMKDYKRISEKDMRIRCSFCAKMVSSNLNQEPQIIRASIECPECIEENEERMEYD